MREQGQFERVTFVRHVHFTLHLSTRFLKSNPDVRPGVSKLFQSVTQLNLSTRCRAPSNMKRKVSFILALLSVKYYIPINIKFRSNSGRERGERGFPFRCHTLGP